MFPQPEVELDLSTWLIKGEVPGELKQTSKLYRNKFKYLDPVPIFL